MQLTPEGHPVERPHREFPPVETKAVPPNDPSGLDPGHYHLNGETWSRFADWTDADEMLAT